MSNLALPGNDQQIQQILAQQAAMNQQQQAMDQMAMMTMVSVYGSIMGHVIFSTPMGQGLNLEQARRYAALAKQSVLPLLEALGFVTIAESPVVKEVFNAV